MRRHASHVYVAEGAASQLLPPSRVRPLASRPTDLRLMPCPISRRPLSLTRSSVDRDLPPQLISLLSAPLNAIVNDIVLPIYNGILHKGFPIPSTRREDVPVDDIVSLCGKRCDFGFCTPCNRQDVPCNRHVTGM